MPLDERIAAFLTASADASPPRRWRKCARPRKPVYAGCRAHRNRAAASGILRWSPPMGTGLRCAPIYRRGKVRCRTTGDAVRPRRRLVPRFAVAV